MCHHMSIFGIGYLTRGVHDFRKWVFHDDSHRQTDGHGDYMTDPAQRGESVRISFFFFVIFLLLQSQHFKTFCKKNGILDRGIYIDKRN